MADSDPDGAGVTEFLEKVEQPQLVVSQTDSDNTVEHGAGAGLSVQAREEMQNEPPPGLNLREPPVEESGASRTIEHDGSESKSAAVNESKTSLPQNSVPGLEKHDDQSSHPANSKKVSSSSNGVTRHRLITGGCIALSLAILSLALIDLNALIEKRGTVDKNLNFIASPKRKLPLYLEYNSDAPGSEGIRVVRSANYNDYFLGYVDTNDNLVLPQNYSDATDFHEGLAAVKFRGEKDNNGSYPSKESKKWAYINKEGKTVIPESYSDAGNFSEGVAPVVFNDFGALIDKTGKIIRTSESHQAPQKIGSLYEIHVNDRVGLVDASGKFVVPPIYDSIDPLPIDHAQHYRRHKTQFDSQCFIVWKNLKCGVMDISGKLLVPIKFHMIASYHAGHAVVSESNRYGIVDGAGNYTIPPKYQFMTMYDDVIAARDHSGNWTVFDSNGKMLNTKIDGAITDWNSPWLNDGMAPVVIGDKCGFLNSKGEIAIPPIYDFVSRFSEGYGRVQKDGIWQYINGSGKTTALEFADTSAFKGGSAEVTLAGPLYRSIYASQLKNRDSSAKDHLQKFKMGQGEI